MLQRKFSCFGRIAAELLRFEVGGKHKKFTTAPKSVCLARRTAKSPSARRESARNRWSPPHGRTPRPRARQGQAPSSTSFERARRRCDDAENHFRRDRRQNRGRNREE